MLIGKPWRLAVLLALACVLGGAWASYKRLPFTVDTASVAAKQQLRDEVQEKHAALRAAHGITLEEFRAVLEEGSAAIIDARAAKEFAVERLDPLAAPALLNVEPGTVNSRLEELLPLQGMPIVIYCNSETCTLAEELLIELEKYGFDPGQIRIFFPGWDGIKAAGLATIGG